MSPQVLTILGASGSIGLSTLDVVRRHPELFRIYALSAHTRWQALLPLCLEFLPEVAVVGTAQEAQYLQRALQEQSSKTLVVYGAAALIEIAQAAPVTTVMAAIVGAAGLAPTLAAVEAGKRVLLANKEALVMAGPLFMQAVCRTQAVLLPIDSEHNAIFQCLPAHYQRDALAKSQIRRILLTASGGPFRTWSAESLHAVTPEQACAHPNWVMGRKISVDSATLMNKGLEVIEAHWLFDLPAEKIEVLVHPQSVIHSMVEYIDGSVLAQLGQPDMRTPIANGLAWPTRIAAGVAPLNFTELAALTFVPPDTKRFPCLRLAYQALQTGGSAPAILNAANEIAVQHFLENKLSFMAIPQLVAAVLARLPATAMPTMEDLLEIDQCARRSALDWIRTWQSEHIL